MTLMTMGRATFRKVPFEFWACAFAGASRKNKTSGVVRSTLQSWRIAAVAETGGEDRSTEIAPEIFKRAGISRALDDLAYGAGNASLSRPSDPPRTSLRFHF